MTFKTASEVVGRIPLTVVEIDLDFCSNTYAVSPCTATAPASDGCYHTFSTCISGDPNTDYTKSTKTYKFCEDVAHFPKDQGLVPCVESVHTTPTKMQPGKGLGTRASVTITFRDFPDNDVFTDPLVSSRNYIPVNQGTFWSKLIARNKYHVGRVVRVRTGYVSDPFDWADFETRSYIIDRIDGPDANGKVTLVAKDVLVKTDEASAQCPKASRVKLSHSMLAARTFDGTPTLAQSIDEYATEFKLTGLTDWDAAYPADGGWLKFDSELMYYSSRVSNIFSGVTRGIAVGVPATHASGAADLKPEGIMVFGGDDPVTFDSEPEFPLAIGSPGYLRIGDEIISYTEKMPGVGQFFTTKPSVNAENSGIRVSAFIGITRGQFNTTIESHDVNDRVQACKTYSSVNCVDVVKELLTVDNDKDSVHPYFGTPTKTVEYADIPLSYFNTTDWDNEKNDWLINFNLTRLISESTDVAKLVKEVSVECNFDIWWDERAGLVKLKAVAPTRDEKKLVTDNIILNKGANRKVKHNSRRSQVWMYYGIKDQTKTSEENFSSLQIAIDDTGEGVNAYDSSKVLKLKSFWHTSAGPALQVTTRTLQTLKDETEMFIFRLDPGHIFKPDGTALWTGDYLKLTTDMSTNTDGSSNTITCQVISTTETPDYVEYEVRKSFFLDRYAYVAPAAQGDYGTATDAEKLLYSWVDPSTDGPYLAI